MLEGFYSLKRSIRSSIHFQTHNERNVRKPILTYNIITPIILLYNGINNFTARETAKNIIDIFVEMKNLSTKLWKYFDFETLL